MTKLITIKDYQKELGRELKGADPALVADALDDAEEHLTEMTHDIMESGRCSNGKEAFRRAVKQYGLPGTIAREYLKQDRSYKKKRAKRKEKRDERSLLARTLGVYLDGRSYRNMLYLFLMFPLGIIYFVYIITGISLSAGLLVTFIGIPLFILFLLSFNGIAWFQGRLTETLLGIRMPKKRRRFKAKGKMWGRLKTALKNPRLHSSVLYLFLMFPLGIIYFTVIITFLATGLALALAPLAFLFRSAWDIPVGMPGPFWFQLVTMAFGLIMLTWSMHLVNILARLHGRMSKKLLLRR